MNEFEKLILSNLNDIKTDLNEVKTDLNAVKTDLKEVKNKVYELDNKVNSLDSKVNSLDTKLNTVIGQTAKNTEFNTITSIKYEKLENEIKQIKEHLKI